MMDFGPGTPGRRVVHEGSEWFGKGHAPGTSTRPMDDDSADKDAPADINAPVNSTIITNSKAVAPEHPLLPGP